MSEGIDHSRKGEFTWAASMLLRKKRLTADEANELTELFENMASANIIAQFGAKLDTLNATMRAQLEAVNNKLDTQLGAVNDKLDTKLDAMNAKHSVLLWAIGFATAILSAVIVFT